MTTQDAVSTSLGAVPRILLATDGTLTHILEAYAAEPVHLVKLSSTPVTDGSVRASLGLDEGERAVRRVILLRGTKSDITFVHAESVVMLDRLPALVARGLQETDTPIGKLLFSCRAETLRELIGVGEERNAEVAQHLGLDHSEPLAARTYRILSGGRPVARITERFPTASWPDTCAPGGEEVGDEDLGVIPRILLATDGTIVHIVEAYAGEPVDPVRLSRNSGTADEVAGMLRPGVQPGERAMRRFGLLRGQRSGRVFVHGDSLLLLDRLPEAVAEDLQRAGGNLLRVLIAHGVGSFRETILEEEGFDQQLAATFDVDPGAPLVFRTFQVVVGGRPVGWITESFPKDGFTALGAAPDGGPT